MTNLEQLAGGESKVSLLESVLCPIPNGFVERAALK